MAEATANAAHHMAEHNKEADGGLGATAVLSLMLEGAIINRELVNILFPETEEPAAD